MWAFENQTFARTGPKTRRQDRCLWSCAVVTLSWFCVDFNVNIWYTHLHCLHWFSRCILLHNDFTFAPSSRITAISGFLSSCAIAMRWSSLESFTGSLLSPLLIFHCIVTIAGSVTQVTEDGWHPGEHLVFFLSGFENCHDPVSRSALCRHLSGVHLERGTITHVDT